MQKSFGMWAFVVLIGLVLSANGCGTKDSPTSAGVAIGEQFLFPFSAGFKVVYNEYTLDTLGVRIDSTRHRRVTFVNGSLLHNGKTAYELIDSIYRPAGSLLRTEITYAVIENGDLLLEFNGAWSTVFKRSVGTNTSYYVRTYNDTSAGFPIPVAVNGKIFAMEAVSTLGGTIQAYKLELAGSVTVGLTTLTFPTYSYFADHYGLIKQTTPPLANPLTGKKTTGTEMVYESKNF